MTDSTTSTPCTCSGAVHKESLTYRGLEDERFEYSGINLLDHSQLVSYPDELILGGAGCELVLTNVRPAPDDDRVVWIVTSSDHEIIIGTFLATPWEDGARVDQLARITLAMIDPATRDRVEKQHEQVALRNEENMTQWLAQQDERRAEMQRARNA